MQKPIPDTRSVHPLEREAALLAAAACIFLTIAVWRTVGAVQPTWPLPAIYFLEMIAVALITAVSFSLRASSSSHMAWAATGIYLVFAILSLFSVGLLYVLITVLFILLAVLSTIQHDLPWLPRLRTFLLAAMGQAALMGLLLRLLAAF